MPPTGTTPAPVPTRRLLLGLIGGNIASSSAPRLHRLAGAHHGIDVEYRLLVPETLGQDLPALLRECAEAGFAVLNVTYPYKEAAAGHVTISDPAVRALGAVNTVLFGPDGPQGFNTDRSGFVAAFRTRFGNIKPGATGLVGAGGAGRAIAFALAELGAPELRLYDRHRAQCERLKQDLEAAWPGGTRVTVCDSPGDAAGGSAGLVNATPVGMDNHPGSPLDAADMAAAEWVFDAVYTPVETEFLCNARRHGTATLSGFELFLYQGIHAWELFSGLPIPESVLRQPLEAAVFG